NQGRINVMWVVGTGVWQGPVGLTPVNTAPPGESIGTLRQTGTQIDIFFVDNQGRINVMWVVGTGIWQGPVGLTMPNFAPPGAFIGTGYQAEDQIDIFTVGSNSALSVMWVVGTGTWNGPITFTTQFDEESLIHEIGHAIGLFHEHMRPDRDNFVRVV